MNLCRWSQFGSLCLLAACTSSGPEAEANPEASVGGSGGSNGGSGGNAGTDVTPGGSTLRLELKSAALDRITAEVTAARALDAAGLLAAHAVPFSPGISYDAGQALGLELIQQASFALDASELEQLDEQGFVIVRRVRYPSMPYGYFDIYGSDLPVFISADMVLEAVHRSFDDILKGVESLFTIPTLRRLLGAMRAKLRSGEHTLSQAAAADADFFLSVAAGLLGEQEGVAATGGSQAVLDFVRKAQAAAGAEQVEIFGTQRDIDFSQFKPRGHYEDSEALQRYFRAMIWLGRIDLRLLETQSDGTQIFRRRQVEAALGLRGLMDAASLADWEAIDKAIGAFVGEHDYMVVPELDQLLTDLGSTPALGLGAATDQAVAQAIVAGQYGEQRIASHLIVNEMPMPGTLPLNASFAFFGQRYTVDSHVFSNVVYDRIPQERFLPNPLDAAFAALANDQAAELVSSELMQYSYAGNLAGMRTLVDAHPASYWQSSLYTSWLSALRTLSPGAAGAGPATEGLPAVARTEAWGRRLLNTQLASWAELRHDTILYAKQSYTAGSVCEFPDAYVEPYPEFFWAIARYAELGQGVMAALDLASKNETFAQAATSYFANTARIATLLGNMAELQRSGMPHTAEQLAFINQAIRVDSGGSGPPLQTGWYKDLYFGLTDALALDPTIADVHTDPNGPAVLHVGTGLPRPIVITVDTCSGPRAYAGVVSAYHEHIEPGFNRLADSDWLPLVQGGGAEDVPWLAPILGTDGNSTPLYPNYPRPPGESP